MLHDTTALRLALHRAGLSRDTLHTVLHTLPASALPWDFAPADWRAYGLPPPAAAALSEFCRRRQQSSLGAVVAADLQLMAERRIELIALSDPDYPPLLLELPDPPPLLYIRGERELLSAPQLAVVGSRRASATGLANARRFGSALAEAGLVVTSGMALGVDGAAHEAALAAGGNTVAVLGAGVDVVYPRRHRALYDRIAANGLLVSEWLLGEPPRPAQFPQRNRIISGLSLGVLVVEATLESGSLITARLALEQNREVFSLPGSIHNPGARGCNSLIRQGAKLVEDLGDIAEELAGWLSPVPATSAAATEPALPPRERRLLAAVGDEPTPLELILERCDLPVAEALAIVSSLELKGLLENIAGCYQRCRPA